MKEKRIYDRDFKETAVKLSMQRADIGVLAIELGISKKLLYSWRSQYRDKGKERFPGRGNTAVSVEAKFEEALRKQNEQPRGKPRGIGQSNNESCPSCSFLYFVSFP